MPPKIKHKPSAWRVAVDGTVTSREFASVDEVPTRLWSNDWEPNDRITVIAPNGIKLDIEVFCMLPGAQS
jgi:hypothetical protein